MRKLLLLAVVIGLCLTAFTGHKCEHIYVQVEQPELKIERPTFSAVYDLMPQWPSGKQEGKELVCVKCFNKMRQVLNYEESSYPRMPSFNWPRDTLTSPDTCYQITWPSTGPLFIPCDSLRIELH